jgi:hypothetical protein
LLLLMFCEHCLDITHTRALSVIVLLLQPRLDKAVEIVLPTDRESDIDAKTESSTMNGA